MLQFPHPVSNSQTEELQKHIVILASILQQLPLSPQVAQRVFHQQFLKSSLFSARIEGNTLTLIEATQENLPKGKNKSKKEINNILRTLQRIQSIHNQYVQRNVDIDQLLEYHLMIMNGIDSQAGKLRNESSAIFDQFGNIIYLTPAPKEMRAMLDLFFEEFNTFRGNNFSDIARCHYYFEKIHPFIDGNGRLGRVLLQAQLQKTGVLGKYILPIDQYFEEHRNEYYFHLEKNTRNIEEFIIFFLNGVISSLESILADIKNASLYAENPALHTHLLPRRQEILNIIEDHPYISADSIARRFPTVPKRTILYDVQWLVLHQLVIKFGSTKGVTYSAA